MFNALIECFDNENRKKEKVHRKHFIGTDNLKANRFRY